MSTTTKAAVACVSIFLGTNTRVGRLSQVMTSITPSAASIVLPSRRSDFYFPRLYLPQQPIHDRSRATRRSRTSIRHPSCCFSQTLYPLRAFSSTISIFRPLSSLVVAKSLDINPCRLDDVSCDFVSHVRPGRGRHYGTASIVPAKDPRVSTSASIWLILRDSSILQPMVHLDQMQTVSY